MTYGTIVVCGGGCYGGYYVRQLARARAAGALQARQILVVDRDPACRVAQLIAAISASDHVAIDAHTWRMQRSDDASTPASESATYVGLPIAFVASEWVPFFAGWFGERIAAPDRGAEDAVVPSPLMPHLLADWVASRVHAARPEDAVHRVPMTSTPDTPWARDGADLARYVSFATWMCPINCIEPPRCPETRSARDWTMPAAVRNAVAAAAEKGTRYDVVALFQTMHRAYGVGMFDVADAADADAAIRAAPRDRPLRVLVASVSHCHGALAELLCEHTARP